MFHTVSHSGFVAHRRLMSSLRFLIRDDQLGKCCSLAYFSLFAPVTTEAIPKPSLFSPLALITSVTSKPGLFRLFSLLLGQTNRMC